MQRKWRRDWERSKSHKKDGLVQKRNPFKVLANSILPPIAAMGILLSSVSGVYANPANGQITSGSGTISESGSTMTINQTSDKLGINWDSFSIGSGETVQFIQPGTTSVALNRVTGNDVSSIYGTLTANGQVFLINSNGVLFAPGAQVNVGGIVASTLNISDSDFLAGNYSFSGEGGSVVNQGTITVTNGGYAALIAPDVKNEGVIVAQQGTVALGAGKAVTLDLEGDGLLSLAVDEAALNASAANHNLIQADGGLVIMAAKAAGDLVGTVVNNSGVIQAKSVSNVNGVIRLDGGTAGTVTNSGTLDASGTNTGETGGTVKVLGETVILADGAKVDVSGDAGGGTALIGGNARGQGTEQNAATTTVAATAAIHADALTDGHGGQVVVWADDTTAFNGSISAKGGADGGNGGSAEVSGKQILAYQGTTDLTAPNGQTGTLQMETSDFTIAADGGAITGTALGAQLGTANVTILSNSSRTGASGDISVSDAVAFAGDNTLTLSAYRDVNVNEGISNTGGGSLVLQADNTGTGTGTVTFGDNGAVSLDSGTTSIYYNPVSYDDAATRSNAPGRDEYGQIISAGSDPYTAKVTGNHTAYMLVNTLDDLQNMNTNLAGIYALSKDIDAGATISWNDGAGFTPIGPTGATADKFTGIFDGDGHVISGLTINRSSYTTAVGLFGHVFGGVIRNVGLENVKISGNFNAAGGLAGSISRTNIDNCYSTGTITNTGASNGTFGGLIGSSEFGGITNSYSTVMVRGEGLTGGFVGGLIGCSKNDNITDSYSTGAVTVTNTPTTSSNTANVGGFIGYTSYSNITNSYSTGTVDVTSTTSWSSAGGLVGTANGGTVTNSYSTGAVTLTDDAGFNFAGGLVGCDMGGTYANSYTTSSVTMNGGGSFVGGFAGITLGSITNSYSTGLVTANGSGNYVGGFLGSDGSAFGMSAAVTNSYWDKDTSGQGTGIGDVPNAAGVTGLTTAQMMDKTFLTGRGWDFGNTWYMLDGYTRPFLQSEYSTTINNAHQLQLMAMDLDADYTLGKNLDLTGLFDDAAGMWNTATGFVPVGTEADAFIGTLDGDGHTISGLTINSSAAYSDLGLFGYTQEAFIHDLGLTNVYITGGANSRYVGAVAGYSGTGSSITNVYSTGAVSDGQHTGGLAGYNAGTVATSYSMSAVSGANNVGGLVGTNAGTITDSYFGDTGTVAGSGDDSKAGGLAGANSGTITRGYSAGTVAGGTAGGLVGDGTGGTIVDAVWDTTTSGQTQGVGSNADAGGVTGLTTAEMEDKANYPGGWNFTDTWVLSGARPHLRWEYQGSRIISSLSDLLSLGANLSGTYILGANIDLTGEWTPIGSDLAHAFTGTLLGNGYTLSGLTITGSDATALGLFGYTQGATISSLNLTGVNITAGTGNLYVGGLVGYSGAGTSIANSTSSGTITASGAGSIVGGLAGYNAGTIENSSSTATVTASGDNSYAGGLAGYNAGRIVDAYNAAMVTVQGTGSRAGGLAGANSGSIISSYGDSTGMVSSENDNNYIGGLVGENNGTITGSYNKGVVTTTAAATNNKVGGLAGINTATGVISGSYVTGTVRAEGTGSSVGGLVGKNAGSVTNSYGMVVTKSNGEDSKVGGLVGENTGSIDSAFSVGAVLGTGTGSTVGGLAGVNDGTITNALWATDTSGQTTGIASGSGSASGVQGLTFADMRQSATYGAAWDTGTWGISDGFLPYLKWQYNGTPLLAFTGTVQGDVAGRRINIVNGGTQIGQAYEFGVDGFYYGVSTSGLSKYAGNLVLLYVAGDPNYKANSLYIASDNGLSGGDLIKDTLIMDGDGTTMHLFHLDTATNQGKFTSPDLIFSGTSDGWSVNGNLQARNFTLGNGGGTLYATGSVTIDNPGDFVINANSRNSFYLNSLTTSPSDPNACIYNGQIIAGGNITITTGGNLIIKPGMTNYTVLTAGGDITLKADSGFINTSGPNALAAGGRWLVYAPEQMIYSGNSSLYYDARAWDYTLPYTGIEWAHFAQLANSSSELGYDATGGLTGDFTLWGYTGGEAVPATGSGFIFTAANPTTLPLTPTQLQRRESVNAAHSGQGRNLGPAASFAAIPDAGIENLPFLTIVDEGVAME